MASSLYTFFMAVQDEFASNNINRVLSNPEQLIPWSRGEALSEMNKPEYLLGQGTHTCRETLLAYTKAAFNEKMLTAPGKNKYVSFLYLKEGGSALTNERINKILKFSNVLGTYLPIQVIDNYLGNKCISVSTPLSEYQQKQFYLASLFLWIFRKDVIMDWLIDYMEKQPYQISFSGLLQILAERFLLESNWSDVNNNPIFMSMFCYCYIGLGQVPEANGPANLAKKFDTSLVSKYFEKLYAPLLVRLNGELPSWAKVEQYTDTKVLAPFVKFYYKKPRKPAVKKIVVETTQESEA